MSSLIFFWEGLQGELGHPEKQNSSVPRQIEGLKHEVCVDIACGSLTSYAITASGMVYNWYRHFSITYHIVLNFYQFKNNC